MNVEERGVGEWKVVNSDKLGFFYHMEGIHISFFLQ